MAHTVPQEPQFKGSVRVSAQRSPQHDAPIGHEGPPPHPPTQVPIAQRPVTHTLPHAPQLRGSLSTATQVSPQHAEPGAHPPAHPPPRQRPPAQR